MIDLKASFTSALKSDFFELGVNCYIQLACGDVCVSNIQV